MAEKDLNANNTTLTAALISCERAFIASSVTDINELPTNERHNDNGPYGFWIVEDPTVPPAEIWFKSATGELTRKLINLKTGA